MTPKTTKPPESRRLLLVAGLLCAWGIAGAGCGDDVTEPYGSSSIAQKTSVGSCPDGWFDAAIVRIVCADGWTLEYKTFGGTVCVRCAPVEQAAVCKGQWKDAALEFACAPGYVMVYSADGACKRCVKQKDECVTDADCFRTGCSGQICSSEHVITTCEWRPEYACYMDENCVCAMGQCGWADDPQLEQCLDEAAGGVPLTP